MNDLSIFFPNVPALTLSLVSRLYASVCGPDKKSYDLRERMENPRIGDIVAVLGSTTCDAAIRVGAIVGSEVFGPSSITVWHVDTFRWRTYWSTTGDLRVVAFPPWDPERAKAAGWPT